MPLPGREWPTLAQVSLTLRRSSPGRARRASDTISSNTTGPVLLLWTVCVAALPTSGSYGSEKLFVCARRSWRDPAGGSPVREGGSARPVASVAGSSATMILKRTQRDDEDCIELRKLLTVEAEALRTAAGNMCGTVLRGTVAPPGSETSSSRQGSCRNLGDLRPPAAAKAVPGRFGKARSRSRTGRSEESDGCRVPMKPRTTPADRS